MKFFFRRVCDRRGKVVMRYRERKLREIKRQMKQTKKSSPNYNPEEWNKCTSSPYAYALNLKVSDRKKQVLIPGRISGKAMEEEISSKEELLQRIEEDLEFLGIDYRTEDNILFEDEWRIAIYYNNISNTYHFARQDRSRGRWSEKISWDNRIYQVDKMPDWSIKGFQLVIVMILINNN